MPAALSPSQIHILFGDGEAEKKPIRTRWQLFISSSNESKMPDALSPSQIHILFGDGEAEKKPVKLLHEEPSTSLNLALFTRRKTVINQ